MKLLTLAAVARQIGVCRSTAKKFLRQIPDVQVEIDGRRWPVMYRQDVLMDFIRSGGSRAAQRPTAA
jgi:hypothetical protein